MGCGEKIFGHEIEAHSLICPNYEEICAECSVAYKPNKDQESHDCFKSLMETVASIKKEKAELLVILGINYDKINAKCGKGH